MARFAGRTFGAFVVIVMFLLGGFGLVRAQGTVKVGNRFIEAHVSVDDQSGKFGITSGPAYGETRFLFETVTLITSHVVFRVDQPPLQPRFACNVPDPFGAGLPRPTWQGNQIGFKKYDRLIYSADTIAVVWNNIFGFRVTMRFIPEKPSSIYDDGADMLVEFSYERLVYSYAELGILLMLDTYNSGAASYSGGGFGDQTSLVTDGGYFQVDTPGRKFYDPQIPVPNFYHVGNFLYEQPLNSVLPVHKLKGTTRNGIPLTPPNLFVIDDWKRLREVAWDLPISVGGEGFRDCATLLRWEKLVGNGVVRTSFGMNNKGSNDLYHCRDNQLFVDIRTRRLVKQEKRNGPYDPEQIEVEMWVANTSVQYAIAPDIRLDTPVVSIPDSTHRLTLDPSTPATQSLQLGPRISRKLVWRLNVNHASADTMAIIRFFHKTPYTDERPFLDPCEPVVTIIGFHDPPPDPPKDTVAPQIEQTGSGRDVTAFWTFRTSDRHLWFNYDTGLDSIVVLANDGNNIDLSVAPYPFLRCDTSVYVSLLAQVVDTTRPGRLVFSVSDCRGNLAYDSVIYRPRPDVFKPQVEAISFEANGAPCNARVFEVTVGDSINQFSDRGDHGLGTIEVLSSVNFKPIEINFDNAGLPIRRFDRRASFRMSVIDTMQNASATIRVADFAGNDTLVELNYCTLDDILPPQATAVLLPDRESWDVSISDSMAWDRGLLEVVEISNLNNNIVFTPPQIIPGAPSATLPRIYVKDNSMDAEITLEVHDLVWRGNPAGHATRFTLRFSRIPDTLAPNIIFTPDPLTIGSIGEVEVNDIHFINNTLYKYDVGLSQINVVAVSPNMRVRQQTPISFSPGASRTTFQVEIIDTLTFNILDSICLEAVDLAGNKSVKCYYYPVVPDVRSPIFSGRISDDWRSLDGTASDDRLYDRGLGSIVLENEVNLERDFSITNLRGTPSTGVSINVIDPSKPIAGTLVINDLVADRDPSQEAKVIHSVRIPFYQPAVTMAMRFPDQVEGGESIEMPIIATGEFPGADIGAIDLALQYSGDATYVGERSVTAVTAVTQGAAGRLDIRFVPSARLYSSGDTLSILSFMTQESSLVGRFDIGLIPGSLSVNGGATRTVTVQPVGDTARSILQLPRIYAALNGDSLTMVNGECRRILITGEALKSRGLAILSVAPQPLTAGAAESIELAVRELPAQGAQAVLIGSGGEIVARYDCSAVPTGAVARVTLKLPEALPSGVYFVRLSGSTGEDVAKVIVR